MCVVGVMPPQTAPLYIFPGLIRPIQPVLFLDSYVRPRPLVMQDMAQGFRVSAMFAMGDDSVTAENPEPLPPGNGADGAGGGNGNGGGRKGVVDAMRRDLPKMRTTAEATGRIDSDIDGLAGVVDRLHYIRETGLFLDMLRKRFGFEDLVDILFHIAKRADEQTEYLTPMGLTEKVDVDIFDSVRPLYRQSVEYERMLLRNGEIAPSMAAKIAFIHEVSGRKGELFRVLKRSEGKPVVPVETVLILLDAVRRYEVTGSGYEAGQVLGFLDQLRYYHSLPEDLRTWAMVRIERRIKGTIDALAVWQDERDLFEDLWEPIRIAWNDLVGGIYLFSPHIFDIMIRNFRAHGMNRLADLYELLRKENVGTAKRLSLYVE